MPCNDFIIAYLYTMNTWTEVDNELCKTFEFVSFEAAIAWMTKASIEIEKLNHHPAWTNIYNKVHVRLSTHDAGNVVTEKDRLLAVVLDGVK